MLFYIVIFNYCLIKFSHKYTTILCLLFAARRELQMITDLRQFYEIQYICFKIFSHNLWSDKILRWHIYKYIGTVLNTLFIWRKTLRIIIETHSLSHAFWMIVDCRLKHNQQTFLRYVGHLLPFIFMYQNIQI